MQPKGIADDWSVILDHTIQIGKQKILIVLGLQLSYLPFNRGLSLADVQPIALVPMQISTGSQIQAELDLLKNQLGTIRQVVADQGSDIKMGVNLYRKENTDCDYTYDIVHKLAHLLHKELKNDKNWEELSKRASETRVKLLQTEYAYLIPPQRRDKARYLNLEELIKWAYRILLALQSDSLSIEEYEFLFKQFAWVFGLGEAINEFHQLWQVTSISREWVRNFGIQTDTAVILEKKLHELNLNFRAMQFAANVIHFLSEESVKAKPYERLLGSSEIIESLIGLIKYRANTQSRSGFTGSVLITAIFPGEIIGSSLFEAMSNVKVADVNEWEKKYFASTIQKRRAKFYKQTPLRESEDITFKCGTEIGTYFTVDFDPETG